jgi:hypothetical protein
MMHAGMLVILSTLPSTLGRSLSPKPRKMISCVNHQLSGHRPKLPSQTVGTQIVITGEGLRMRS